MNKKRLEIIKETAVLYDATVEENTSEGGIFMSDEKINIDEVFDSFEKDRKK